MARTGSQLQMFIDYIGTMRGWGRSLRRAVGKWYTDKDIKQAVYQAVKYRQRYNWTHRDLLRKAHPKAASSAFNDLFAWITHGTMPPDNPNFALIHAYEQAKTADPTALGSLIRAHDMTWEMMPSEHLDKPEVWEALAEHMPLTALIRNLATLTRVGVIAPMKSAWVCERLNAIGNPLTEDFTRIHPINVLSALLTYRPARALGGATPGPRYRRSSTRWTKPSSGPSTRRPRPTSGSTWASTCRGPWAPVRSRVCRDSLPGWRPPPWPWPSPAGSPTTTSRDLPLAALVPARPRSMGSPEPPWPHCPSRQR